MFLERRGNSNASPIKESALPPFAANAQHFVDQTLRLTRLKKQLGYSSEIMESILPVATAHYLLVKGKTILQSSNNKQKAHAYVIAAMRVYPQIVDEVAIQQYSQKPLDARDPHDVAVCLGERLAEFEASKLDEFTLIKRVKRDIEKIKEVANMRKRQVAKGA